MCDTLAAFIKGEKRSFLGKNSDREPEELQFVYLSQDPVEEFKTLPYIDTREEYIEHSFKTLKEIFPKFQNNYGAILSRPIWMWGAEMGVNEYGLSIGNEAVFSRDKVDRDGLLGMDILRLALHNCKSAAKASEFIIRLISEIGQGGDGGYKKSMKYHNSFIIKDFKEGYILETSGRHFVLKKIKERASISNSYSIRFDYKKTDYEKEIDFKKRHENRLYSFFSKGDIRHNCSSSALENIKNLQHMINILRLHEGEEEEPKPGMKSICMHPGGFIKSETTSSMVVDYIGDKVIVWHTSSPNPCVSLYKPMIFSMNGGVRDIGKAIDYSKKLRKLSRHLLSNFSVFSSNIKPIRDEYELKFQEIIYKGIEAKSMEGLEEDIKKCMGLEREYLEKVRAILE